MSLLAALYASEGRKNDAQSNLFGVEAQKTSAERNEIGPNAEAERALQGAQAGALGAGAAKSSAEAGQIPANDASARGLQQQQTNAIPQTTASTLGLQSAQGYLDTSNARQVDVTRKQQLGESGYETGTDSVAPGKGQPGPTDTVPAMLTPGEGVLNKGAMEHFGTDVIDHMNKVGLVRMAAQTKLATMMGMPDPHGPPAAAPAAAAGGKGQKGYETGTTDVRALTGGSSGPAKTGWSRTPQTPNEGSTDLQAPHYGEQGSPNTGLNVIKNGKVSTWNNAKTSSTPPGYEGGTSNVRSNPTPSSVVPGRFTGPATQGTTGGGGMAPATPISPASDLTSHLQGFETGGLVSPLLDHMPSTIDPTSYALGILHAVGTGKMNRPQKALPAASGPK